MPFGNPVVGGDELIRNDIRSQNYVQGLAGWRIGRDGSSEFNNAVFRGVVTAQTIQASQSITYKGTELQTLLDAMPKGVIAYGQKSYGSSGQAWGTGMQGPIAACTFPVTANRLYKVRVAGLQGFFASGGPATIEYNLKIQAGTSITFAGGSYIAGGESIISYEKASWSGTEDGLTGFFAGTPGTFTVGLFAGNVDGSGLSMSTWANDTPWVFWIEDVGIYPPPNPVTFGAGATVTYFDKTYWPPSGWVESYQASGAVSIATNHNVYAYQGDGTVVGNPGGDTEGCFFFDSATIRADLAGATIDHVYLYSANAHSYGSGGITALLGSHNADWPAPGSVPSSLVKRWTINLAAGGDGWTGDIGAGFGGELQAGTSRGLCMGYAISTNPFFYGYFANAAIRILYHK